MTIKFEVKLASDVVAFKLSFQAVTAKLLIVLVVVVAFKFEAGQEHWFYGIAESALSSAKTKIGFLAFWPLKMTKKFDFELKFI